MLPWASAGVRLTARSTRRTARVSMVLYVFYVLIALPFLIWVGAEAVGRWRERRAAGRFDSYVTPEQVEHILSQPEGSRARGELHDVSVMFTNVTDSVGMFERLGDLAAAEVINRYYGAVAPAIRKHNGYICKFIGDGVMAFFGAPISPDAEHVSHAVEAVLDIQAAVDGLNAQLADEGRRPLAVRIGVATGLAVVGDAGPATASDYTVMGDVVNTASRLEKLCKAAPARNLVSDVVVARLNGRFVFRAVDVNAVPLSTTAGVNRVYEVIAEAAPAPGGGAVAGR